jgi:hypothetical protein
MQHVGFYQSTFTFSKVKDIMMAILQIAQAKDVHGHVKSKAWTTSFIFK